LGIFFVPIFFVVVRRIFKAKPEQRDSKISPTTGESKASQ
jgi:hypothetical protein